MGELGKELLELLDKSDEDINTYLGEIDVPTFKEAIKQLLNQNIDRNKLITALNILKTI